MTDLHHSLRDLLADRRIGLAAHDAEEFRASLDDFLSEEDATVGELNLLVDAVRLGAVSRMVSMVDAGGDAEAAIRESGTALARDRGSDDTFRGLLGTRGARLRCGPGGGPGRAALSAAHHGASPRRPRCGPRRRWPRRPNHPRRSPRRRSGPCKGLRRTRDRHGDCWMLLVLVLVLILVVAAGAVYAVLRPDAEPRRPTAESPSPTAEEPVERVQARDDARGAGGEGPRGPTHDRDGVGERWCPAGRLRGRGLGRPRRRGTVARRRAAA